MRGFINIFGIVVLAVVAAQPQPAMAGEVLTFAFSELDGDFDSGGLLFSASDDADSDGEVTRAIDPVGDAFFFGTQGDGGFPGPAAFSLLMGVSATAEDPRDEVAGIGTIVMTDVTGDVIFGAVNGTWINNGAASFIGVLTDISVLDGSGDGTFDGTDSSSISLAGIIDGTFDGNIVTLAVGDWFVDEDGNFQDFSDATTLAVGAIVPEPVTLSLLALGSLALVVRRRR